MMPLRRSFKVIAACMAVAVPVSLAVGLRRSRAADHLDPPARTDGPGADRAADIADVFAWYAGTGASQTFTAILTFAGPNAPAAGQAIPCDRDVLYTILIDNTGDAMPEYRIETRFGMDDLRRNCFVNVRGLPGTQAPVVGRVESTVNVPGGARVFAGLRDDAFFFDLQGFRDTIANGRLLNGARTYFANDRDFFARKNTPAIVVEFPLGAVRGAGTSPLRIWATTARHPAT
jgi:hypothetical protein